VGREKSDINTDVKKSVSGEERKGKGVESKKRREVAEMRQEGDPKQ